MMPSLTVLAMRIFLFFYAAAATEIYTLSLHDALPICCPAPPWAWRSCSRSRSECSSDISTAARWSRSTSRTWAARCPRSEEHTSELQSLAYLVCRLLLEKKNLQDLYPVIRPAHLQVIVQSDDALANRPGDANLSVFLCCGGHRDLHSFPTRRSSDLLSGAAMGVAIVLALPLGVLLGHLHRGSLVAINLANVGRALPKIGRAHV